MKTRNHFIPLLLILALGMALTACQKCETCSYTYTTYQGERKTYAFPEACGDKAGLEAQKSACQTAAQLAGTTCACAKS